MNGGLGQLVSLLWTQEAFHQRVLQALLANTDLPWRLGLWRGDQPPTVLYEPLRGLFDLALAHGDEEPSVFIELKAESQLESGQIDRQRAGAGAAAVAYVLLGGTFFRWSQRSDMTVIGLPELASALSQVAASDPGEFGAIAIAYAERLRVEGDRWEAKLPAEYAEWTGFDFLRFYQELAAAWPVAASIYPVTNRGGQQWVINPDAWVTLAAPGWETASLYWEVINARTRFKIGWSGERQAGAEARDRFREALELAAVHLDIQVNRPRRAQGKFMTSLELAEDVRDSVLVDGRVTPERAAAVYHRASSLFDAAVARVTLPTI